MDTNSKSEGWQCPTENCQGELPIIRDRKLVCEYCAIPIDNNVLPCEFIKAHEHLGYNQMDQDSKNETYYVEKTADSYRISVFFMYSDYYDYEYTRFVVNYYPYSDRWFIYQKPDTNYEIIDRKFSHEEYEKFPYSYSSFNQLVCTNNSRYSKVIQKYTNPESYYKLDEFTIFQ